MKTKKSKLRVMILPGVITVIAAIMLFYSCKKDPYKTSPEKNHMVEAAKLLNGEMLSGNIITESTEREIAMSYDNGYKYIFIEKMQDTEPISINSIQSAEVIISKYGVILKDLGNNKTYFLTNNDPESIKKFEAVKSIFAGNFQHSIIFGVTIVNAEKV